MDITRRNFLKSLSVLWAVPVLAKLPEFETDPLIVNVQDIILTETEVIPHVSPYHAPGDLMYRGIAHLRDKPENKKYFSMVVADECTLSDYEVRNYIYSQLAAAFV